MEALGLDFFWNSQMVVEDENERLLDDLMIEVGVEIKRLDDALFAIGFRYIGAE